MSLYLVHSVDELRRRFFDLQTPRDIAHLLEVDYSTLVYHLYIVSRPDRYTEFTIPKASGGERTILAPVTALKIIQKKLAKVLQVVYKPRLPAHGFLPDKSILTNASNHTRKRYVLNIDIEDFFPYINFGRVRGMFMAGPYHRPSAVATVLAQICCFNNQLPQGAPTSPIVSNMICAKMDGQLLELAEQNRCFYTRYADDLTFSTTIKQFPGKLATILATGEVQPGEDLVKVIEENGFKINPSKLRLQTQYQRQQVTGLTTNLFPNVRRKFVRQMRAMLHDWETNGLETAQRRHREQLSRKHRPPFKDAPTFQQIVKGKIDFLRMVKGSDDPNYRRFLYKYKELHPDYVIPQEVLPPPRPGARQAVAFTSGKTDWRHLRAAILKLQAKGKFTKLELIFRQEEKEGGDPLLLRIWDGYARSPIPLKVPYIFIFDRDDSEVLKQVGLIESNVADSGNNVYAVALPVPPHRQQEPEICIELLYPDQDLKTLDSQGRRIFLTNEFHPDGRHLEEDLIVRRPQKLRPTRIGIYDNDVFDSQHRNVALPKAKFADNVLNEEEGFRDMDFSGFEPLFELIQQILFPR